MDHRRYIDEILPVALKYGNEGFGDNWTFQRDGVKPHMRASTQEWCQMNFPSFIDKDHWLPNSPDLNSLDYSIWDEFAQQINWAKVKSRKTLIDELKRNVKRIRDYRVGKLDQSLVEQQQQLFAIKNIWDFIELRKTNLLKQE